MFRSGMEGVPTVHEYIDSHLKSGGCLGFDARIVSAGEGIYYSKKAEEKNAKLCVDSDLTDRIWTDRPAFPESRAFILTTEYAGKTPAQKLEEVRRIRVNYSVRLLYNHHNPVRVRHVFCHHSICILYQ